MFGCISILPYTNVYTRSGRPRAKEISKILLPSALEIASS